MLTILKTIFFSSSITLINGPIYLTNEPLSIKSVSELDLVNRGAHIDLDVTNLITPSTGMEELKQLAELFPVGCLQAVIEGDSTYTLGISSLGMSSGGIATVSLGNINIPLNFKFSNVRIDSCKNIEVNSISWVNWGK